MLVLTRAVGETIQIGDDIKITLISVDRGELRIRRPGPARRSDLARGDRPAGRGSSAAAPIRPAPGSPIDRRRMTSYEFQVFRTALAVAAGCLLLAGLLLALHLRRVRRNAIALAARVNARFTMERHWADQAADGRTQMLDTETLRRVWRLD